MNSKPTPIRHVFPQGSPFDTIVAAFTTRNARNDSPLSEDLNTGLHTCDDPIAVRENRQVVFGALGLDAESLTVAQQAHGDKVCLVDGRQRGRGALRYEDAIPATDALVTDTPGVSVGVFTADCVPIFLFDPRCVAVGIVHAGWRGAVQGVAAKAVQRMREEFGTNPKDMHAAIGPSIGKCCYDVHQDVYDEFHENFPSYAPSLFEQIAGTGNVSAPDSNGAGQEPGQKKWYLDLWLANRLQLEECGLHRECIYEAGICSACNSHEFFSFRKLGPKTGRTLSVISILPPDDS